VLRLDKTPTSWTRLENRKELAQSTGAFDNLGSYLERVSPVMELDAPIMTLHGAKGLAFPLVFLPGWEEGVFPRRRSLDENGDKGLEAAPFLCRRHTRPRGGADFVCGQPAGLWPLDQPPAQPAFVDKFPIASVEAASETGYCGGGRGLLDSASRWDEVNYASGYDSPGSHSTAIILRPPLEAFLRC
jgi:DNA helicase-2/ATP-dependent DNA helicase PcrA